MLTIHDVDKIYNKGTISETAVLKDFNLEVEDNQFVAIIGSNGSGKSTLLNLICGSVPVDHGTITLNGQDLGKLKEFQRAKMIGRVFQNPSMGTCPNMTVLENMALADQKGKSFNLGIGVNRKRIDFYREELCRLELGLEDKLEIRVGLLSGGQRQAMSLLMCTMSPLQCLILDEHTAALDPSTSDKIIQLTQEIVRQKKLMSVMVTHNLRHAVKYGDRLIMMHKGNILLDLKGEEKERASVDDLLKIFYEISIETGNSI